MNSLFRASHFSCAAEEFAWWPAQAGIKKSSSIRSSGFTDNLQLLFKVEFLSMSRSKHNDQMFL
jgi:hypothetical protein